MRTLFIKGSLSQFTKGEVCGSFKVSQLILIIPCFISIVLGSILPDVVVVLLLLEIIPSSDSGSSQCQSIAGERKHQESTRY